MLMPKKNRVAIYESLFKEGVLVAVKDVFAPKHSHIDVPNLHVMKAMKSLKSRGYVTEQFAWRHCYWCLTNEGIQYLREFLHLPAEIVPATLKRTTRAEVPRAKPKSDGPPRQGGPSDRQDYRRGPGGPGDKKAEVGAGSSNLEFRGGFGRGRGGFGGGAASGGQ